MPQECQGNMVSIAKSQKHTLTTLIAETLPRFAAQVEIVVATSPSFEKVAVALTGVKPQSKESKGEETHKKGKMTE